MKEIFKDIPSYEGYYKVSNIGTVKSLNRVLNQKDGRKVPIKAKTMKPHIHGHGYLRVSLNKNNKRKFYKVHQLVAMAFLGHKPNGMKKVIDHKNGNKTDNRVENLQIVTQRQNSRKQKEIALANT